MVKSSSDVGHALVDLGHLISQGLQCGIKTRVHGHTRSVVYWMVKGSGPGGHVHTSSF